MPAESLTHWGCYYGTDKATHHAFTDWYEHVLQHLRHRPIMMLEIGVQQGASLRMWQRWLHPHSTIHGLDVSDASHLTAEGFTVHQASQVDHAYLQQHIMPVAWDLIVDDGSHYCRHQQLTWQWLWPGLKPAGTYIMEDVHTSTWPQFQDTSEGHGTTLQLLHDLQHQTWPMGRYHVSLQALWRMHRTIDQVLVHCGRHGCSHSGTAVLHKKGARL